MGELLKTIGEVVTDEKVKNVNEVEALDKNIVAILQNLKDSASSLEITLSWTL